MEKNTPISSFARSKVLVKGAAKIGAKKTISLSKKAFLSKEERKKEDEKIDNEIAEIIFKNLSFLKGTAIKISQALVLHNIIPSKLEAKLSKSFNNVHPISQALVLKVLENEFNKNYKEQFDSFNLKPFASASLGQVHLAKKDNKSFAIKIQYPSIDKTIKSDLKLLSSIAKTKKELQPIVTEVGQRLYEEIDYTKELQNTIWAHKNFSSKDIIIPKVYKEFSNKHILSTQFIQADDLYSWLKTKPSKKAKIKIANLIFEIFTKSVFELKQIQADPNPANYLISKDEKLVLIDFGCVKKFNDKFIKNYKELFKAYYSCNKDNILFAYKNLGFISDASLIDETLFNNIMTFNKWVTAPFENDTFIFTKEYLQKGVKYANLFSSKPFTVVNEFVFLDRTMHGLFSLFANMKVPIDMRCFKKFIQ